MPVKVQKGGKLSSMTLLVNGLSGKPFTIRVKTGDTAEEIYAKIQDKEGVPHQNDQHHKEELKRGTNMPLTPVPAEQLSFPKPSLVDELQPPEVSSPEVQDQEELQLVEENSMSPRAAGAKQETSASTSRPASDPSLRQNRAAPSPTVRQHLLRQADACESSAAACARPAFATPWHDLQCAKTQERNCSTEHVSLMQYGLTVGNRLDVFSSHPLLSDA